MRNITVDDETYRRARVRAAELDSSVSALVQKCLIELAGQEMDFERRKRLETETLATIRSFSAADRLTRREVHERSQGSKRRAAR
jgi:post-segregation antitoxin (ccd killing protein)